MSNNVCGDTVMGDLRYLEDLRDLASKAGEASVDPFVPWFMVYTLFWRPKLAGESL